MLAFVLHRSWVEWKEGETRVGARIEKVTTILWQNKLLNRWPQTASYVPLRITSTLLSSRRATQPDVAATNSSQMFITAAATCGSRVPQERPTWILLLFSSHLNGSFREPLTGRQRQLFQLWFGSVCGAEPTSVRGWCCVYDKQYLTIITSFQIVGLCRWYSWCWHGPSVIPDVVFTYITVIIIPLLLAPC